VGNAKYNNIILWGEVGGTCITFDVYFSGEVSGLSDLVSWCSRTW